MYRNILDGTITAEEVTDIDAAIATLEARLTILVGLTAKERLSNQGMGPQNEGFASRALIAGQQHSGLMPRELDLAAIQRDKALREVLLPRFERLRQLTNKMEHTIHLAGSEYFKGALAIYGALKLFGRAAGLDDLIAELGRRFAKPPKQPVADAGPIAEEPVV
jgi:hypothetical protein